MNQFANTWIQYRYTASDMEVILRPSQSCPDKASYCPHVIITEAV